MARPCRGWRRPAIISGMPSSQSPRFLAGRWLFALTVPCASLALGSIPPVLLVGVAVVAALACALLWVDVPPLHPTRATRALVGLLVAFALFTALQSVPLPADVVRVLAPMNAEIWSRADIAFGEAGPSWHPLSVAPVASRVEVLRGVFYLCMFLSATSVVSREGGRVFLERLVVASSVIVALAAVAHPAVGATKLFGLYKPRFFTTPAPLLNANHLSAYANVGVCVALGAALSRRGALPVPIALGVALVLSATSIWAASRGGAASLVIGAALTAILCLRLREKPPKGTRPHGSWDVVTVGVAVVGGGVMLGLASGESQIAELFHDRDVSKVGVALSALRLVRSSPWLGFGRGSFETVFPLVREGAEYVTFTHPENFVVQWLVEWGVIATFLLGGALVLALRPRAVLATSHAPVGAWAALVGSALHDLVDFHLEVPGVMALLCVCAALVAARQPTGERVLRSRYRVVGLAAAGAALLAAGVVFPDREHTLVDERARLADVVNDRGVDAGAFRQKLHEAIGRFPGEGYFPLLGAVRAQEQGVHAVVPWVARALECNPRFGRAHLVLARALARRNPSQARLELRLAYETDASLRGVALTEGLPLVEDVDSARELVPVVTEAEGALEFLAEGLRLRLPATSAQLDEDLADRSPDAPGVLRRKVRAASSDAEHGHIWCGGARECATAGLDAARRLTRREPGRCEPLLLLARLRIAAGELAAAFDELERGVDTVADRRVCLLDTARLAIEWKQDAASDRSIERLSRSGCTRSQDCAELYGSIALLEESRGAYRKALVAYRRAIEADPTQDALLERVGQLGERVGMFAEAVVAYESLARRRPAEQAWETRAAAARERVRAMALPSGP